ncbi:MAG TPA: hypothetical protein QF646_07765, partial [Candidatus Poseidoniales archaeon]|nr:hypothetical protein [Candidatus Poseidoniales archaeon]
MPSALPKEICKGRHTDVMGVMLDDVDDDEVMEAIPADLDSTDVIPLNLKFITGSLFAICAV